jgi:hypothetical protein
MGDYKAGQIINVQGTDYEIESVTPTRITRDEYGREVDWPAFEISAVSPPNRVGE